MSSKPILTHKLLPAKPDDVLTGMQLGNAIVHAVTRSLQVAYTNRTVGDFINALHELGIRDSDPLASIEYGVAALPSTGWIEAERDEHGGIEIREVRR